MIFSDVFTRQLKRYIESKVCKECDSPLHDHSKGCWLWTGKLVDGYGQMQINKKAWKVHRVSYIVFTGQEPLKSMLHKCNIRRCVYYEHIYDGTNSDNRKDSINAGTDHNKRKTHCPYGHLYDSLQSNRRKRRCSTCSRRWLRESATRRRDKLNPSRKRRSCNAKLSILRELYLPT